MAAGTHRLSRLETVLLLWVTCNSLTSAPQAIPRQTAMKVQSVQGDKELGSGQSQAMHIEMVTVPPGAEIVHTLDLGDVLENLSPSILQ